MHPVIVIEWKQGYSTEVEYTDKSWKAALNMLFDENNGVRRIWRKYPVMNMAA